MEIDSIFFFLVENWIIWRSFNSNRKWLRKQTRRRKNFFPGPSMKGNHCNHLEYYWYKLLYSITIITHENYWHQNEWFRNFQHSMFPFQNKTIVRSVSSLRYLAKTFLYQISFSDELSLSACDIIHPWIGQSISSMRYGSNSLDKAN